MATPPAIAARVQALRAAGWTIAAIAAETETSTATVKRVCARGSIKRGEGQDALIAEARQQLFEALRDDKRTQGTVSSFLLDTLAHVTLSREKALDALECLAPTSTRDAAVVMRALAAHSVAIKNQADTLRRLIPHTEVDDGLPELVVHTLTETEIADLRSEQCQQMATLNGDAEPD